MSENCCLQRRSKLIAAELAQTCQICESESALLPVMTIFATHDFPLSSSLGPLAHSGRSFHFT
jgi:hypothetical protein